jgi:predicted negative regulator of RcsB-dependent stress response
MSSRGAPISDSNANDPASRPAAPAGLHWGDPDAPAPASDRSSGSGEREVKGLFGVGKPPPPAGASLAGAPVADPIASLFAADTIVKAPGIHDAPSEAELGRWRATMQSSLFEERVVDPSPPPPAPAVERSEPPAPAPRAAPAARLAPPAPPPPPPASGPTARAPLREAAALDLAKPPARPVARVAEPDSEPPPAPPVAAPRNVKTKGKRRRAAEAEQASAETTQRRRRFERGPSKAMLAALGICAASVLAALVIVLGAEGGSVAPTGAPQPTAVAAGPAPAAPAAPATATATAASAADPKAAAPPSAPTTTAAPQADAKATAVPAKATVPSAEAAAAAPAKPAAAAPSAEQDEEAGAPESLLRAGRQALSADDAPGAERIARQALAQAPTDHHAMELLVLALMDQDRGAEALPFARRMVQRRSRRVPYRLLLGDLLLMVGDEAAARAEWKKALELAPSDRQIKRRLGL